MQENETRPPSYTTHKNKFKMDQRLKCQTQSHKNRLRKHRQQNLGHCSQQYFIKYISPGKGNKRKKINKWNYIKITMYFKKKLCLLESFQIYRKVANRVPKQPYSVSVIVNILYRSGTIVKIKMLALVHYHQLNYELYLDFITLSTHTLSLSQDLSQDTMLHCVLPS